MKLLTTIVLLFGLLPAGCRKTRPADKPKPGGSTQDTATTSGTEPEGTVNYEGVFGPSRHVVGSEKPVGEETEGIYKDGGRSQPPRTAPLPPPRPKPPPVQPVPRNHPARGRIGLAKSYAAAGLKAKARKILQDVAAKYPDTEYAAEAEKLLKDWKH